MPLVECQQVGRAGAGRGTGLFFRSMWVIGGWSYWRAQGYLGEWVRLFVGYVRFLWSRLRRGVSMGLDGWGGRLDWERRDDFLDYVLLLWVAPT